MNLFFLVLLITTGVATVSGLICYDCVDTDKCQDTFKKDAGVANKTCAAGEVCHKLMASGAVKAMIRYCQPENKAIGMKCKIESSGGTTGGVCQCNTDLCNTADQKMASVFAIAGGVVAWLATNFAPLQD